MDPDRDRLSRRGRQSHSNAAVVRGSARQYQSNDEAVQAERLGEDEYEHHAHVHFALLRHRTHGAVAHDANGDAGAKAAETAAEARGKVRKAGVRGVVRVTPAAVGARSHRVRDDHGDDQAVYPQHSCHHDRDHLCHRQTEERRSIISVGRAELQLFAKDGRRETRRRRRIGRARQGK